MHTGISLPTAGALPASPAPRSPGAKRRHVPSGRRRVAIGLVVMAAIITPYLVVTPATNLPEALVITLLGGLIIIGLWAIGYTQSAQQRRRRPGRGVRVRRNRLVFATVGVWLFAAFSVGNILVSFLAFVLWVLLLIKWWQMGRAVKRAESATVPPAVQAAVRRRVRRRQAERATHKVAQLDYLWGFSALVLGTLTTIMVAIQVEGTAFIPRAGLILALLAAAYSMVRLLRMSWPVLARPRGYRLVRGALLGSAVHVVSIGILLLMAADTIPESEYGAGRARQLILEAATLEVNEWTRPLPAAGETVSLTSSDLNPHDGKTVYERAAQAIVTIRTRGGHGTAFLVSRDGLALTNEHVVRKGQPILADFGDGETRRVRVLRADRDADVALIQVNCAGDCYTLELGTSGDLEVGTDIVVIGTPADEQFYRTATRGIVSAFRRFGEITELQTDAAVNGGNSGSPMLDARTGKVLGIVASSWTGFEGIHFGIAIDDALKVLGLERAAG